MCGQSGNPGVQESESENKTKQRSQVTGKTEKFPVTGAQFTKCVYRGGPTWLQGHCGDWEDLRPDICLVNEAAAWAPPFALTRSGFAGTEMQRGWPCSMAVSGAWKPAGMALGKG